MLFTEFHASYAQCTQAMLLVRPTLGGFNDNSRNDISLRNEKCHFSSYSPAGCARNYFSVGEMKKHSRTIFRSKLLTSCHLTHYIWNTKCVSTTGRCIFVTNKFECTFRKRMKNELDHLQTLRLVLGCIDADFCMQTANTCWTALDQIYKIYIPFHRSDLEHSAKIRLTFLQLSISKMQVQKDIFLINLCNFNVDEFSSEFRDN